MPKKESAQLAKTLAKTPDNSSGIYCLGAMSVDRKFDLLSDIVWKTSNPATSTLSVGGVARNIAENLGRLSVDVSLLSLGGFDQDFNYLKEESEAFINLSLVRQIEGFSTCAYNAVLDMKGEMQLGLADMQINEKMDLSWIGQFHDLLSSARLLIADLNLPAETIAYILSLAKQFNIDLFIIPVSGPKMSRLPRDLSSLAWLIVNQDESETFFQTKVKSEQDFAELADLWLKTGVENVVITRGARPSIYVNQSGARLSFTPPEVTHVLDVTGAGDSYASGIIFGHLQNLDPRTCIRLGMTNSYHTIQSPFTVRQDLTAEKLLAQMNILFTEEKNI